MPANSFQVEVNPRVLRWARETAGYSSTEVAQRLSTSKSTVNEDTVNGWERGREPPSWRIVRRLAKLYKRPVAALLLANPPDEPSLPPDFRKMAASKRRLSPESRYAIRFARWLQSRTTELADDLGWPVRFEAPRVRLTDDPERVAQQSRTRLGVNLDEQTSWSDLYAAFRHWRGKLQEQHVLVFQLGMPLEEVRGFSLYADKSPAIVVNSRDAISARVFTLFHEYGHLLLGQPGICIPTEGAIAKRRDLETFCNRFAAAFLIPSQACAHWRDTIAPDHVPPDEWIDREARRFGVSRYVVLGRLRGLGVVSAPSYQGFSERWQKELKAKPPKPRTQRGGPTLAKRCLLQRGRPYVSLVMEASRRGLITSDQTAEYLGVKLKDLSTLETALKAPR